MFFLRTCQVISLKSFNETLSKVCLQRYGLCSYSRINDLNNDVLDRKSTIIKGWVKGVRKLKNNIFIDVNDGSCSKSLQVVVPKEAFDGDFSFGSSVVISGDIVVNPKKQLELQAENVEIIGNCNLDDYPFRPKKSYSNDYIRQYLHLRLRTKGFSSLLRVRHNASLAINDFFANEGFINVNTPILTSNDCEGAGEVFSVKPDSKNMLKSMKTENLSEEETFFGNKAYLTVSGQLHLEAASRGIGSVYTFGPTFRAENSKSRLHLSEFYMVEAEKSFVSGLEDIILITEGLVRHVTKFILDKCAEDVDVCRKVLSEIEERSSFPHLENLIMNNFTVMSYDEAAGVLSKNNDRLKSPFIPNEAFSKDHELFLVQYNAYKPLFIVNWPRIIKPFYMKQHPEEPNKVLAFDLLSGLVGELCGGSLREDDLSILEKSLVENKLADKLNWYLELRKYGNVLTGGFGMGFERYLQVLLNISNIKDVIPFPRWPHHCDM